MTQLSEKVLDFRYRIKGEFRDRIDRHAELPADTNTALVTLQDIYNRQCPICKINWLDNATILELLQLLLHHIRDRSRRKKPRWSIRIHIDLGLKTLEGTQTLLKHRRVCSCCVGAYCIAHL